MGIKYGNLNDKAERLGPAPNEYYPREIKSSSGIRHI